MSKLALHESLSIAFAALLVLPFVGTTPAFAQAAGVPPPSTTGTLAARSAGFVRETCLGNVDDFSKVDSLANERGWRPLPPSADRSGFQGKSTYLVEGDKLLTISSGMLPIIGEANRCTVIFAPSQQVNKEEFFTMVSAGLKLKKAANSVTVGAATVDVYEIQREQPNKALLEMIWNDSSITAMSVTSYQ